jgi:hypothetical protein
MQCEAACKGATGKEPVFDAIYACKAGKPGAISSETGLVFGWHFDEGSGSSAIDASGNGYTGSMVGGIAYTPSRFGTALKFDGFDDYVQITNLNIPTTSGSKVTVEFWMNWSGLDSRMPMGFRAYDLWFASGCFGFNTGNGDLRGMSTTSLANKWVFVSAIFNSGDSRLSELYINGVNQTLSQCGGVPATQYLSTTMTVGSWPLLDGYWYQGMIDEFRLYNRALTPQEIANHYLG